MPRKLIQLLLLVSVLLVNACDRPPEVEEQAGSRQERGEEEKEESESFKEGARALLANLNEEQQKDEERRALETATVPERSIFDRPPEKGSNEHDVVVIDVRALEMIKKERNWLVNAVEAESEGSSDSDSKEKDRASDSAGATSEVVRKQSLVEEVARMQAEAKRDKEGKEKEKADRQLTPEEQKEQDRRDAQLLAALLNKPIEIGNSESEESESAPTPEKKTAPSENPYVKLMEEARSGAAARAADSGSAKTQDAVASAADGRAPLEAAKRGDSESSIAQGQASFGTEAMLPEQASNSGNPYLDALKPNEPPPVPQVDANGSSLEGVSGISGQGAAALPTIPTNAPPLETERGGVFDSPRDQSEKYFRSFGTF